MSNNNVVIIDMKEFELITCVKCAALECKNNHFGRCNLKLIIISGDGSCNDYEVKHEDS